MLDTKNMTPIDIRMWHNGIRRSPSKWVAGVLWRWHLECNVARYLTWWVDVLARHMAQDKQMSTMMGQVACDGATRPKRWHNQDMYKLQRRGWSLVNQCFLCMEEEEPVDHILPHCTWARGLWNLIFYLYRIVWVMPCSVEVTRLGWHNSFVDKKRK